MIRYDRLCHKTLRITEFLILVAAAPIFLEGCNVKSQTMNNTILCSDGFYIIGEEFFEAKTTTPVEDFKLHEVSSNNRQFIIYEGNQPDLNLNASQKVHLGDGLYIWKGQEKNNIFTLIKTKNDWPQYIHITTNLSRGAQQDLMEFTKRLILRTNGDPPCPE